VVKRHPSFFKIINMAFNLSLSYIQNNDNKAILFTDTTGNTEPDAWGQSGNINPSDIDGAAHTLELDVSITIADGTIVTYDTIDLYTEFGPFATIADLEFLITPSMLIDNTVALGDDDTELPDGIYDIQYTVDAGLATEAYVSYSLLIDGQVRNKVYDSLRQIPVKYNCKIDFGDCSSCKTILQALFWYSYLKAMVASCNLSKREEILTMLNTLERY
jgi:hypothetical protein